MKKVDETNIPIQLPPAIQDRIKELEDEVKRLKDKYEPYDIGKHYAFASNKEQFDNGTYSIGILTKFDPNAIDAIFQLNGFGWYKYARKIKTIELC